MPIVTIHLMEGRSHAAKAKMAADVTTAIADSLEVPKEKVRIIIQDMSPDDYCVGGQMVRVTDPRYNGGV